ncbi:helix-turn-helix domain-containing protein [Pendulispora rubella]
MSNEEKDKYLALQERLSTADPDCLTRSGNEFVIAMVLQIVQELAEGQKEAAPGCDPFVVGQQLANFLLPSPPSSTELPGRVRECLRAAFSHDANGGTNGSNGGVNGNPEMRDVARTLGVSPRTLQRRLQQVGSSFTHEVDCVRRELACQYLADTNRPLGAIALQLGFGEVGSFFRTFRRWTQTSPRRFRLHHTPRVASV